MMPPGPAFAGFRLPAEAIVVAVGRRLRYVPSYRGVEKLFAERGVEGVFLRGVPMGLSGGESVGLGGITYWLWRGDHS